MTYRIPEPYLPLSRLLQDSGRGKQHLGTSDPADRVIQEIIGAISTNKAVQANTDKLTALQDYLFDKALYARFSPGISSQGLEYQEFWEPTLQNYLTPYKTSLSSKGGEFDRFLKGILARMKNNQTETVLQDIPVVVQWLNGIVAGGKHKVGVDIDAKVHTKSYFHRFGVGGDPNWQENTGGTIGVTSTGFLTLLQPALGYDRVLWRKDSGIDERFTTEVIAFGPIEGMIPPETGVFQPIFGFNGEWVAGMEFNVEVSTQMPDAIHTRA